MKRFSNLEIANKLKIRFQERRNFIIYFSTASVMLITIFALLLSISLGCTPRIPKMESNVYVIPLPDGDWVSVAWIDEWIILGKSEGTSYSTSLWKVQFDGSKLEQLTLLDIPDCDKIGYKHPSRLPNGKLGYFVDCGFDGPNPPSLKYLASYDIETETSQTLLTYSLVSTGKISWNPEMTKGITDAGSILVNRMYWFTSHSSQEILLDFTLQAYGAAWSPNGQQIAFVAAPYQGRDGFALLDSNYNLYLMDSDGENIRPIINNFKYTDGVVWSPNGKYLVFDAKFPFNSDGLMLYNMDSGVIQKIAEGKFAWYEWSPDGSQIVSIRSATDGVKYPYEVVIIQPIVLKDDLD